MDRLGLISGVCFLLPNADQSVLLPLGTNLALNRQLAAPQLVADLGLDGGGYERNQRKMSNQRPVGADGVAAGPSCCHSALGRSSYKPLPQRIKEAPRRESRRGDVDVSGVPRGRMVEAWGIEPQSELVRTTFLHV